MISSVIVPTRGKFFPILISTAIAVLLAFCFRGDALTTGAFSYGIAIPLAIASGVWPKGLIEHVFESFVAIGFSAFMLIAAATAMLFRTDLAKNSPEDFSEFLLVNSLYSHSEMHIVIAGGFFAIMAVPRLVQYFQVRRDKAKQVGAH